MLVFSVYRFIKNEKTETMRSSVSEIIAREEGHSCRMFPGIDGSYSETIILKQFWVNYTMNLSTTKSKALDILTIYHAVK